ncbi:MAG TPA: FeoA family protein [Lacunisphaera sp.]|jgi:ferrous iron transport protein A|nr:FeoA family protein [Lacunisphaera sp.]
MPHRKHLSPLCQLPPGASARICEIQGHDGFAQRLREMGFGEAALVKKISGHTTSLCQVNGTRIALNHDAAKSILVEPLPALGAINGTDGLRPNGTASLP